jgi:hypothetical protein
MSAGSGSDVEQLVDDPSTSSGEADLALCAWFFEDAVTTPDHGHCCINSVWLLEWLILMEPFANVGVQASPFSY